MASFVQHRLTLIFKLAAGTFNGQGDSDTVRVEGMRVICDIDAPGGMELSTARIQVFGLSKAITDRLTVLAWQSMSGALMRNEVTVEADDVVIFTGDVVNAMSDYQTAPEVPFNIFVQAGHIGQLQPGQAESYPGPVKASVIFNSIAQQLGVSLENNGVDSVVTDMYLPGTPMQKLRQLAKTAGVSFYYLPPVLAICPEGKARTGFDSVLINTESGMVGWPTIDRWGVTVTTLYNPAIQHGGRIKIESQFPQANGEWFVQVMSHRLESEIPGGVWFTRILATEQRYSIVLN